MARTVDQINQQLIANIVTFFASAGVTVDPTKWSKRNLLRAMLYAQATGLATEEQLMDVFRMQIEQDVLAAAPASSMWLQNAMFQFQYSATNPQIVQVINGIIQYPVIDTTLRPITACSISTNSSNNVVIKVAQGNPFQALTANMVTAAQSYINYKGDAGINYIVQSGNPDQMYINANVWFQGQYSNVILANITAAINAFFQTLNTPTTILPGTFNLNGSVKMSALENAILGATGVNDVELLNVRARADGTPFANGVQLISNTSILQTVWNPIAGYTITEQTPGQTLATSLNLIAQ